MLCIKFARKGKTKEPTFRLIICEKTRDPWGTYLENMGFYNPRTKEASFDADRIKYWLSKGAQTTNSVWNILVSKGIIEGKKKKVSKISKKRQEKIKKAQAEKAQTAAAAEPAPAPQA